MDETPAISYVIPTLNSAATLATTLLSLRQQTENRLDYVVMDSGSTDGTHALCQQWQVPVSYVPPGNMYRAINAGLRERLAQIPTEWLAYLNSDDWLYPQGVARLLEHGSTTAADVVYGNCDYVDAAGRFVYSFAAAKPEQLLALFRCRRMGFAQPATIFRRSLFTALNGFDESYRYKADADFFIRALLAGKRFTYVDGPAVACFRLHADQLSLRKAAEIEQEGQRLFGQAALQPNGRDWLTLLAWRFRNVPHYSLRMLRASLLAQRLRAPQSLETYDHR